MSIWSWISGCHNKIQKIKIVVSSKKKIDRKTRLILKNIYDGMSHRSKNMYYRMRRIPFVYIIFQASSDREMDLNNFCCSCNLSFLIIRLMSRTASLYFGFHCFGPHWGWGGQNQSMPNYLYNSGTRTAKTLNIWQMIMIMNMNISFEAQTVKIKVNPSW